MLPLLAAGVAAALLIAKNRPGGRPEGAELVIDLDTGLPQAEVSNVVETIRRASRADIEKLDVLAHQYAGRGLPFTAQSLAYRSWQLRGSVGAPPTVMPAPYSTGAAPPTNGHGGAPQYVASHSPSAATGQQQQQQPSACFDAQNDPATCEAVKAALATETNADKLHAFAESLRPKYPQAAGALDARAKLLGWTVPEIKAMPPATHDVAVPQTALGGSEAWTPVAPNLGNVPSQFHAALIATVQKLGMDASMLAGSERPVAVGDRTFVFSKPMPGPGVTPGAVWVTRMTQTNGSGQSASTGYGSGPLWPVDIVDRRGPIPPDRRFVGSPTIVNPVGDEVLSPTMVPIVMIQGMPGNGVPMAAVALVGGIGQMDGMADAVNAVPPGAVTAQQGKLPEIFGASMPEIVGGETIVGADTLASFDPPPMDLNGIHEFSQSPAVAEQMAMEEANGHSETVGLDRRAPERPRPAVYVEIRAKDKVWPPRLAKLGSGNKHSYEQLVAMNPHLVTPGGHWSQFFIGDEVVIPPTWAGSLRANGYVVKMDPGVN